MPYLVMAPCSLGSHKYILWCSHGRTHPAAQFSENVLVVETRVLEWCGLEMRRQGGPCCFISVMSSPENTTSLMFAVLTTGVVRSFEISLPNRSSLFRFFWLIPKILSHKSFPQQFSLAESEVQFYLEKVLIPWQSFWRHCLSSGSFF